MKTWSSLRVLVACALPVARAGGATAPQRPANGEFPSVSPDGRLVAFWADRGGTPNVYLIGADGGERQLTHLGGGSPRWSPDGREIRFAGLAADSGAVFAIAPDGGERRLLARVPGRSPVLSPDGRLVAFLRGPWTSTALFVAKRDGSGARQVAGGGKTTAWNPAWSPDGRLLAYTYGDSTRLLQVHVVNLDGTNDHAVTRMPATEGSAQLPAWSADGGRLAVQVSNGQTHQGHIWVVDLVTGAARKLAPHAEAHLDEVPSWFPDGEHLAFQSNRTGRMEVWVMNADGTGARQMTGVADPLRDSLVALEKASWEAWQRRDGGFFQSFLSDDHVEVGSGGVTRKAVVVAGVASPACVVHTYATDSFELTRFNETTALLTYHATQRTECNGRAVPSPAWVSSLYVRRDGRWVNAAYQQSAPPG